MSRFVRARLVSAAFMVACGVRAALAAVSLPPMSVGDLLDFREIREVRISPRGETVAYILRHPNLETNRNDDNLVLQGTGSGGPRRIVTTENLGQLRWDARGDHVYGLARVGGSYRILAIDVRTGEVTCLRESRTRIDAFDVSRDGTLCLVASWVYAAPEVRKEDADRGRVYDWDHGEVRETGRPGDRYVVRERFEGVRVADRAVLFSHEIPFEALPQTGLVRRVALAPDNASAAIELIRQGHPDGGGAPTNLDIEVMDLRTGQRTNVLPGSALQEVCPVWLGDSGRLFFLQNTRERGTGYCYDLRKGTVGPLPWATVGARFDVRGSYDQAADAVFLQQDGKVTRLSLAERKVAEFAGTGRLVSFADDFRHYAGVSESLESPPEVAIGELGSATPRRLTQLNPMLERRSLGKVEKLSITNSYGTVTTAYLLHPTVEPPGQRAPLVVASYGFTGRFVTVAEWHTTFPAQALAGRGYAVLMINVPPLTSAQQLAGDPVKARENEGWQVLASVEAGVTQLVERGLVDPARVGLYGWSHGAFVVEFVLAHSRFPFAAACVGEGGDYNPSEYWLWGGSTWARIYGNTFGGPFTARTAAAYLEFCPVLSVDQVRTPLLMEFREETAALALEFYVPLRMQGVPAELVTYEQEEHNFQRPSVREASMERKLDWFDYWMNDRTDPAAAKMAQFERWLKMKTRWKADGATLGR